MAPIGRDYRKRLNKGGYTQPLTKKTKDRVKSRGSSGSSKSSGSSGGGGGSNNNYTGGTGGGGYGAQTRRQIDQGAPKRRESSGYIPPQKARNNYTGGSGAGGYGAQTRRGIDNGSFTRHNDWRKTQRENERERTAQDRLVEAARRRVDRGYQTIGEQLPGRRNYRQHNLQDRFNKDLETSEAKWHGTSRKSGYYTAGGDLTGGRQYYVKDGKDWRKTSYEDWKKQNDHDQKEEEKFRKLAATDPRYKNDPRANWDDYGGLERMADTVSGAISSRVHNIHYGLENNNSVNHRQMALGAPTSSIEMAGDNLKIRAAYNRGGEKAANEMREKLAKMREKEKEDRFRNKLKELNAIDKKASAGEAKMQMAQHGTKGLAKFGLETLGAATGMAVDIGIGAALGGVGAIPSMVVGAAGSSARYTDKDEYGRSKTMQALRSGGVDAAEKQMEMNKRYAAVSGAIEGLSEKIFAIGAPMQKAVGKGLISFAERDVARGIRGTGDAFIRNLAKKLSKGEAGQNLITSLGKAGISMTGEGLEEVIAGVLNPVAEQMLTNKDEKLDWGQVLSDSWHDAMIGGAIGGLFGGAEVYNQARQGKFIRDKVSDEELIKMGKRSGENTVSHRIANQLESEMDQGVEMNDFDAVELNAAINKDIEDEYREYDAAEKKADRAMAEEFGSVEVEDYKRYPIKNLYEYRKERREDEQRLGTDMDSFENELDEETPDGNLETVKHYEDTVDKATATMQEKLQGAFMENQEEGEEETGELPELNEENRKTVQAIANLSVGEASLNDLSLFSEADPIARETLQETLGVELPVGNEATRKALLDLNAENRRSAIELSINDNIVNQVRAQLGAEGYKDFKSAVKDHGIGSDHYATAYDVYKYMYDAGLKGSLPYDKVPVPSFAKGVLPEDFMRSAYVAGRRAAGHEKAAEGEKKSTQERNEKSVRKAKTKKKGRFENKVSEEYKSNLDEKERARVDDIAEVLKVLADTWKVNIQLVDGDNYFSGNYQNGVITVAANMDDPVFETFVHEFMHHMEKLAPKEWKSYADFVARKMDENDPGSFERAVDHRMQLYNRDEDLLKTREDARREVIADSTRALFRDKDFPKELTRHDASLAAKIRRIIKDMLAKIKERLGMTFSRQQAEFKALWKDIDDLQQLSDLFVAAAEAQIENETTRTAGTQYEIKEGMTPEERYEELKNKIIHVVGYNQNLIDSLTPGAKNRIAKGKERIARNDLKTFAQKVGVLQKTFERSDLGISFTYTTNNYKESVSQQMNVQGDDRFDRFVKMLSCLDEIVDNAVVIEKHFPNKEVEDPDLKMIHVMVSAFKDGEFVVPVKLVVKEYITKDNGLYITMALDKINETALHDQSQEESRSLTISEYSIAKLLKNVKKNDGARGRFSKYISDMFLSDDNIEQKKQLSLRERGERKITDAVTGFHSGQIDARIESRDGDNLTGYLEYSVYNDSPSIKYIHTEDGYRRQGVATEMLQHLQSLYPDKEIEWGSTTPDGTKLQESATYTVENDDIAVKTKDLIKARAAIRKTEEELGVLYDKEDLTDAEEKRLQELGNLWDTQHSAIYDLEKELEGKKIFARMVRMPNDKQYAMRERDDEYMKAVESGDMETAQRMVDEAAKAAMPNSLLIQDGEFRKMWHHTDKEFTSFLPGTSKSSGGLKGIYFTPQENSTMANQGDVHKSFYLNVENMKFAFGVKADKEYVDRLKALQDGVNDRQELADINRQFKEETGVDAFFDWQNGWYNVMTPEQIKSADPVTYDDNGKVIPLSERFNLESDDTRFALREPVEQVRDLIAQHNLTEDKLLRVLKLGGFPMPSIAVTNLDHSNFGAISVLFGKETIDAGENKANKVYSADAWTPTVPQTEYEVDYDTARQAQGQIEQLTADNDYFNHLASNEFSHYNAELQMNREGGLKGYIDRLMDNAGVKYAYLKSKGEDVQIKQRKVPPKYDPKDEAKYIQLLNAVDYHPEELVGTGHDLINDERLKKVAADLGYELGSKSVFNGNRGFVRLVRNAYRYATEPETNEMENDYSATSSAMDERIDKEDMRHWLENMLDGIVTDEGIWNGMEPFTPAGNSRSFKQLHYPVTAENIVKAMKAQGSKNVSVTHGIKPLRAELAKTFKNVDDIRKNKSRLKDLSEEELQEISDELDEVYTQILDEIYDANPSRQGDNSFITFDALATIMEEIAKVNIQPALIIEKYSKYGWEVPKNTASKMAALFNAVHNMPVYMFEAKPERVVGFDEIKQVILPESASQELKEALSERNIPYSEYDPDKEGARAEAVNQAAEEQDIKFSLREDSDGNELSPGQQEFFKDSKVRDDKGRLMVMYHGSPYDFSVFDRSRAKPGNLGRGFYFSNSSSHAGQYGNLYKVYLNIVNPLDATSKTRDISKEQLTAFVERIAEDEDYGIENYGEYATVESVVESVWGKSDFEMMQDLNLTCVGDMVEALKVFNEVNGTSYDGIITNLETVTFDSNQAKDVNNENPTKDPDIQYKVKEKLDPDEAASVSYDALVAKPDMPVILIDDKTPVDTNRKTIIAKARRNVSEYGKVTKRGYIVNNADTGNDIIIGRDGLEHGLERNYEDTARIEEHIAEYIKNAIRINYVDPVKPFAVDSYILLGFGSSEENMYPAYFVIDTLEGRHEVKYFDILYSANGKKIEGSAYSSQGLQAPLPSKLSIKELLDIVNAEYSDILSQDVLNHYGITERRNTKLGQSVKYKRREQPEDYEEENERLREKIDKLRSEMKLSHGTILADKDAARIARDLLDMPSYVGGKKLNTLVKELKEIYADMAKDETMDDGILKVMDLARDFVNHSAEYNEEAEMELKALNHYLRTTPLYVPEKGRNDIVTGGKTEWNMWRKKNFGKIKLVGKNYPGAKEVDQYLIELNELFPGIYNETYGSWNSYDNFRAVIEYRDSLEASIYMPYNANHPDYGKGMVDSVAAIIFEHLDSVVPGKNFADRKKAEKEAAVQKTKDKYNKKISKLTDKKNAEKRAAVEKTKEHYQELLQKIREEKNLSTEEKLRRRMEKEQERDAKRRERATRRKLRASIERDAKHLSDMLLKPTDNKHLPKGYDSAVAALLNGLDFETIYTDKWIQKHGQPSERVMNLRDLREQYAKIVQNETAGIEADDYMMMLIEALSHKVDGKRLADLDTKTLKEVQTVVHAIRHQIASINRAFSDGIKQTISEIGNETIAYMNDLDDQKVSGGAVGRVRDFINVSNAKPVDFFDRLGSPLQTVFQEIVKGEDAHINNIKQSIEYIEDVKKMVGGKNPFEKWSGTKAEAKEFELSSGESIELTPAQVMSLYALNKREQARRHIFASGVVVAPVSRNMKNKVKKKLLGDQLMKTHVRVTYEDVVKIVASMTEEQKAVADKFLSFLNNECAAWGNETSMKLNGYEKFREKNYFPIKSSDMFLNESTQEKQNAVSKLKNTGFTKAVTEFADNPIVIDDFFRVCTGHINTMSMYNAFVPAITDFERVYNYNDRSGRGIESSVKQSINSKFGDAVNKYIATLLQDLNTQYNRDQNGLTIADELLRRWKSVKIGANARVLVQQPTAITRAQVYIDYKYLSKSLAKNANPAAASRTKKRMWDTAPIAYWKHLGFAQTDVSRDMNDILMGNRDSKWNEFAFGMYGFADDVTWTRIFGAVEEETRTEHPEIEEGSKEWKEHVNERFRYIVDRTQVVDSTLHRSQMMRSKDWYMRSITSFMAEPTTQVNMWLTMLKTARDQIKEGDGKAAAKTITRFGQNYIISMVTLSVAASLISAMRESWTGDDDDDERMKDMSFVEKWLKIYAFDDFTTNINLANQLPWVKDIISLFEGYDVQRADLSMIADAIQSAKKFKEYFDKDGDVKYSWKKLAADAAADGAALFGIPVSNVERDITAARKMYFNAMKDADYAHFKTDSLELNPQKNKGKFIDYYLNELEKGNKDTAEEMRKFLKDNKITQDDIDKTVSRRLNEEVGKAIEEKKPDKMKNIIKKYKKNYDYSGDDVSKKVRTYFNDELKGAIEKGDLDKLDKVVSQQKKYGMSNDEIDSSVAYWTNRFYKSAVEKGDTDKMDSYDTILKRSGMKRKDIYMNRGNMYIGYYDMLIYNAGSSKERHRLARKVASMYPDMTGENYILDFVGNTKSKQNISNWRQRKWTKAQIGTLRYRD